MRFVLNPFTANLDAIEDHFGTNGIFLTDTDGVVWRVTVDTSGALVTTIVESSAGTFLFTDNANILFIDGTSLDFIT